MPRLFGDTVLRGLDANGNPVSGARLRVFASGTTTPVTAYSDAALTTPHPSPIIADSAGVFPPVFVLIGPVKVTIETPDGAQLPGSPVNLVPAFFGDGSEATMIGAALIRPTNATMSRPLAEKLADRLTALDFVADAGLRAKIMLRTGTTADRAAMTAALSAAIAAAADAGGGIVRMGSGRWFVDPVVLSAPNIALVGDGPDLLTVQIAPSGTQPGIWVQANGCAVEGMTIEIDPPVIGQHDGLFGTAVTVGYYFTTTNYAPIKNVAIANVRSTRTSDTNKTNHFVIIGDVEGVTVRDVSGTGGATTVLAHWGAKGHASYGAVLSVGDTCHPRDITVENVRAANSIAYGVFLSACYDVRVRDVAATDVMYPLAVVAGDVGATYAPAEIANRVCSGISIENVHAVATDHAATLIGPIFLRGSGIYNSVWQRAPFRSVSVRKVVLDATALDVGRQAVMLRDVYGETQQGVTLEDFSVLCNTSRVVYPLRIRESAGVIVKNFSGRAHSSIYLDQSQDITVTGGRQIGAGDVGNGVTVIGSKQARALVGAVSVSATSLVLDTGLSVRMYPGDVLRSAASAYKYVIVTAFVDAGAETVPIRASDWSFSNGESVFLDRRAKNIEIDTLVEAFETGISVASDDTEGHASNVIIRGQVLNCYTVDVELSRVDDAYVQVMCRGGGRERLANGSADTRCLTLRSTVRAQIVSSRLAMESGSYRDGISFLDDNCVSSLIADNYISAVADSAIGGADVSAANKSANKDSVYRNNRLDTGGLVTPVLT